MKYAQALKKYFGFDTFRDKQKEVVDAILKYKRDVCVVMFTGSGKSLCFQFPAVFVNGMILVISPLISLMNDQQMKLNSNNISACSLNSTVGNKYDIKAGILENKYRLVYITPEYLITQETFITQLYENKLLTAVAVDEAHCTSMWGNDFRQAYKALGCLKDWMPDLPTIALTATATPKVQQDIIKILKLKNPLIIKTTFDRPNLIIKVFPKLHDPIKDILPFVKNNEPTIIYCQTRKMTDDIAYELKKKKIVCGGYHAGMNSDEREKIHRQFSNKKLTCIVATVAFGMGIDSVIRRVIHYGIPKDMESYYQEIGRAGRDGNPSDCILFYALNDMNTNNYFINQITNTAYRNHMVELALSMKNYVFTSECRRKYILEYFGELYPKENCASCDNCLSNKKTHMHDFAKEAKLLLQIVNETGNIYGKMIIINILRGSLSKKIPGKFKKLKAYGMGTFHTENWWRIFMAMLINNGYVKENAISRGNAFSLAVTKKALLWLDAKSKNEKEEKLMLSVPDEMLKLLPIKQQLLPDDIGEVDEDTIDELLEFSKSQDREPDNNKKKGPLDITYDMFQKENKSINEIAKELNLKKITVEEHISKLHKKGCDIDTDRLNFTDEIYETVADKIKELNYPSKLKSIKDELPKNISYLHIKLTQNKMDKEKDKDGADNGADNGDAEVKQDEPCDFKSAVDAFMKSRRNYQIDKEYNNLMQQHMLNLFT